MSKKQFALIGASGHAKVILELLQAEGKPVAFMQEPEPNNDSVLGVQVLREQDVTNPEDYIWIIAIGNNHIRKAIDNGVERNYGSAMGQHIYISPSATIGVGTVVMNGVSINASTSIGKHCIINTNASVDHDCTIEDYVHLSPNVALAGGVSVGECTHIGIGASVIQKVKIGKNVIVGAGAVVVKDIPDNVTVAGVPAKIIKQN